MPPKSRKHLQAIQDEEQREKAEVSAEIAAHIGDPVEEDDEPRAVHESDFLREDGLMEPSAPFWTIKVQKRVRANHMASFSWQNCLTYNGERWTDWHPDPPIERVKKDAGSGDFRYDVYHRNRRPKRGEYPEMEGPLAFYVPHDSESNAVGNETAPAPREVPPHPTPAPAPAPSLDVPALVTSIAQSLRPAASVSPAAGGGVSQELVSTIGLTKDKADRLEREIEAMKNSRLADDKEAAKDALAELTWRNKIELALQALDNRIGALEKRDPVKDIKQLRETAHALGMESGGAVGVAKEGVAALREIIAHQSAQGSQGQPASPTQPQQPQQQQALPMTKHWHTADNGEWKQLGDLVYWIGGELLARRDLTTDSIIFKAYELVGHDEVDSSWLARCQPEDVRKLFAYVFGDAHAIIGHWPSMLPSVETVLAQYPAHVANKFAEAKREFPAWLEEALRARNLLPKPIDPRTMTPKGKPGVEPNGTQKPPGGEQSPATTGNTAPAATS